MLAKLTSAARRMAGATALAVLLAGPPWALLHYLDQPWPDHWPTWTEVGDLLTSPLSDNTLGALLVGLLWLAWASFAWSTIAELAAALTGVRLPQPRALAPARGVAALLVALITGGVLATTAQAAGTTLSTPAHATPTSAYTAAAAQVHIPHREDPSIVGHLAARPVAYTQAIVVPEKEATERHAHPQRHVPERASATVGEMTLVAAGKEYTYTVRRDDTLSEIAEQCLGDANRWPEIYALNRGTHFSKVGGTLTNPNLIYPGWTLHLPDDATAPNQTPPHETAPPSSEPVAPTSPTRPETRPSEAATPTAAPTPSTGPSATAPAPSTSVGTPPDDGIVGPATPGLPSTTPGGGPSSPSTATSPDPSGSPSASDRTAVRGVTLSTGSWVDLGLAAALAAAVALIWTHRRRRYTPRPPSAGPRDDSDLAAMPPVLDQVRRGLRPHLPPDPADSDIDALFPDPDHPIGDGVLPVSADSDPDGAAVGAPNPADAAPVVPALAHPLAAVWPPAGVGLAGPGAHAAARGFLVAGLATGGLDDPDNRTWVVMPSATTATLLGTAAVSLPKTPRLTVTAGLDDALDLLEAQTLHRSRLVYQHETDDVAALRAADPYEEPLPPILLIADATGRHERTRVAALLAQGQRLDIHGVLLGEWPDGDTITVTADGATSPAEGDAARHGAHPADVGRLTVLDPTETADLLSALAESHTGRPQPPAPTEPPPAHPQDDGNGADTEHTPDNDATPAHTSAHDEPDHQGALAASPAAPAGVEDPVAPSDAAEPAMRNDDTVEAVADPDNAADDDTDDDAEDDADDVAEDGSGEDDDGARGVQVMVLGGVEIVGADPKRKPRALSRELLAYLAAHDGSATVDAILENLVPEAPARKVAPHRLHTYVSDLRGVLRHNGGAGVYITHPRPRYALNPATVDVDLWRMRAAITAAATTTDPEQRVQALRCAVAEYRGPLADGYDYLWIEAHREAVRRQALDATTALVDALDGQPEQQLAVVEPAITLHPYAEHLYRAGMRAHHQLGHIAGIRELRRAVTAATTDLDVEPEDDTIALADRLVTDLQSRGGRTPLPRPGAAT
jgi:DNA-binding SARP family transcriptional activator